MSGKRVHLGYVVIGSLGLGLSMFAIVAINPPTKPFMILVFIAAFFAGFFKIPLNSYVQDAVKGRKLGDILGYLNVMVFIFILLSAGVYALFNFFTAEEVMFEGHPKEVVDTLMVFAFIGLVSLATGVFFYFSVAGAKEDFHEIIKGNLRRGPVEE
jgi:acyl-[acyl-carrier-protein]-phospholipid O-acyltransferase/long-chain-fatty-acid--[acyl-carrier-protein] ligase